MKPAKIVKVFLIVFLGVLLAGCSETSDASDPDSGTDDPSSTAVSAGDYEGTADGFGGEVTVIVTLDEQATIIQIETEAANETADIGGQAAPKIAEAIVEHQSVNVDAVSGATRTSEAVKAAVSSALEDAGVLLSNYQSEIEKDGEDETLETDVVIVGAGGAGTAAALAAVQAGHNVIIIEKTDSVGGNTKLSSGFFAVGSSIQEDQGLDFSVDTAVKALLEFNSYLSNGPLTRAIIEKSGDTVNWLSENGMEFTLQEETTQFAHEDDPYKYRTYHKYVDSGAGFDAIYSQLESSGAVVYLNTTFEELITDGDKVTGVLASKSDGGTLTVNAKASIICTGGYGANTEKIGETMNETYLNTLGASNAGEGLSAMEDIGAVDWDSTGLLHGAQLADSEVAQESGEEQLAGFSSSSLTQMLASPLLWVDPSGSRFVNEDVVYDTAFWANAAYAAGGKYFFVVDEATLQDYTAGSDMLISQSGPGANMDDADFVELAEEAVAAGTAFKGETLEELADDAGMNATDLESSVERYNEMVTNKEDTDYDKSAESLLYTVESGSFYAFDCRAVILGTVGGVRVNEKLEVIDQDSKPIEGLYTGGANAGGYYEGKGYPPYEGLASGFAWTSGRIAGESASNYLLENAE